MSVIIYMNENKLKHKGKPKLLSDLEQKKSKSGSHREVAVEEIWSRYIIMQSKMSVIIYMNDSKLKQRLTKIIKWTWTEKVKVRVTQKGCSWRDLIKVYKHAKYNVCP